MSEGEPEGFRTIYQSASQRFISTRYSGEVLSVQHFADRKLGSRVRSTFYPVHVGTIFGWPTRDHQHHHLVQQAVQTLEVMVAAAQRKKKAFS